MIYNFVFELFIVKVVKKVKVANMMVYNVRLEKLQTQKHHYLTLL
jgi:hypothetical protein